MKGVLSSLVFAFVGFGNGASSLAQDEGYVYKLTVKGITQTTSAGNLIRKSLERLEGVEAVRMELQKGLFIVTPKKKSAVKPDALRRAVPERFEVSRVEISAVGTVTLKTQSLLFEEPSSKLQFAVTAKQINDNSKRKELQQIYDDLLKAVKAGKSKFRVSGEFTGIKYASLSLESFEEIKTTGPGMLAVTIEVKGMT